MSEITKLNILLAPKYNFMLDALQNAYPETGGYASRTAKYEFIHGLILLMKYSKREGISIADAYSRFMNDKEYFLKQNMSLMQTKSEVGLVELSSMHEFNAPELVRESLNKKRGPYKPRTKKVVQEGPLEPLNTQEGLRENAFEITHPTESITQQSEVKTLDEDDAELDRLLAMTQAKSVVEEDVVATPNPDQSILARFKTMKLSD